jgi:hypothetical protein
LLKELNLGEHFGHHRSLLKVDQLVLQHVRIAFVDERQIAQIDTKIGNTWTDGTCSLGVGGYCKMMVLS